MKKLALLMMTSLSLNAPALAASSHRTVFLRDAIQEEYLKVKSDPDSKITPARVLRWLRGMSSVSASRTALTQTPSSTEFQPTVDTYNGEYRVIAAVTFKFH